MRKKMKYLGVMLDAEGNSLPQVHSKQCEKLQVPTQLCQRTFWYSYEAWRVRVAGYIHIRFYCCSSLYYHREEIKHTDEVNKIKWRRDILCNRLYRSVSTEGPVITNALPSLDAWTADLRVFSLVPAEWQVQGVVHWRQLPALFFPQMRTRVEKSVPPGHTGWVQPQMDDHHIGGVVGEEVRMDLVLAQMGFASYLYRRNHWYNDQCPCGIVPESARHVFREWARWTDRRPTNWPGPVESTCGTCFELFSASGCWRIRRIPQVIKITQGKKNPEEGGSDFRRGWKRLPPTTP